MLLISQVGDARIRDAVQDRSQLPRKTEMEKRLKVWRQNYRDLVAVRIAETYTVPQIRQGVSKHISTIRNPLRQIINAIAIAYDNPPTRIVSGLPEDQAKAFGAMYRESDWNEKAETWLKIATLTNVVHLIPYLEDDGEIDIQAVHSHNADVIFGEDCKQPDILIWPVNGPAAYCAVDSVEWVWYDKDFKVIKRLPHGLEGRPWVALRVHNPPEDDYWDMHHGHNLLEGTIEVSRIAAQMGWVRQTNSKNLLYLFVSPDAEIPANQALNGEAPLFVRSEHNPSFGNVDNVVAIKDFTEEIGNIVENLAESWGVPLSEVDPDTRATVDSTNIYASANNNTFAKLAKLRNRQIKYLESAERKLAYKMAKLATMTGASWDPKYIKDNFRISFPPLAANDHPKAQVETAQALMSVGALDQFSFYQQLHPNLTLEECKQSVMLHLEARTMYAEIMASRNLSNDPAADSMGLAETQGRIGGLTAAVNRETELEAKLDQELSTIDNLSIVES